MTFRETVRDIFNGAILGSMAGHRALQSREAVPADGWTKEGGRLSSLDIWGATEAAALSDLELQMEDQNWRLLSDTGLWDFAKATVLKIVALSRVMYLVNPLIKRAVTVQELYVWGSGCRLTAKDPDIQKVVDRFFKDPKNQAVIGENWAEREREQRIDGNQFLIFFINPKNGAARVRLIPIEQIGDIICNPQDRKEPWYYKWTFTDESGKEKSVLIPDIDYSPRGLLKPREYKNIPVRWNQKVLHVKSGGLSSMKWGIPELFSALNWATAYKKILENFSTILAAYARVAMVLTGNTKASAAAAKSQLGTGLSSTRAVDNTPPMNTASMLALAGGQQLTAVKTAHSTTGPDEARALRSMVAAGSDTPEHFFGDSDIGNFATSKTLDRPTELKMVSRQKFWGDIQLHIVRKLIEWDLIAFEGLLSPTGWKYERVPDAFDSTAEVIQITSKDKISLVEAVFPPIVEADLVERVRATVQAITLGGAKAEGIIPDRAFAFKLLMVALGMKNPDELQKELYPVTITQGFADPAKELEIKKIAAEKPVSAPVAGPKAK